MMSSLLHTFAAMTVFIGTGYVVGRTTDQRDFHIARRLETQRNDQEQPLILASMIAKMGYCIWDEEKNRPLVVSEQHARNHGATIADFKGDVSDKGVKFQNIHPDDRNKVRNWTLDLQDGNLVTTEYRVPVGETMKWVRAVAQPILDDDGNLTRTITASLDVTEQKIAERVFSESQRLDAVGRLTAGIAHDFNNILTVVSGNLEIALLAAEDLGQRELLTAAFEASDRGAKLSKHLLAFGRNAAPSPELLNVNNVIDRMDDLLRRTMPTNIQIETRLEADLPKIETDRTQLESAILNLAINARDAMPDGGTITLETDVRQVGPNFALKGSATLAPGEYVVVSVHDSGTGIAADMLDKIWEPFYTTKPTDKGTGLGLSMVHGFMAQSGGQTRIVSEVGQGAIVHLYFPLTASAAREIRVSPPILPRPANSDQRTVLLVEDPPNMQSALARRMSGLGMNIALARDAQEALQILRQSDRYIDLVVSDIHVTDAQEGDDLVDQINREFPDLKILLMTQGAPRTDGAILAKTTNVTQITRPIRHNDLPQTINRILYGAGSPHTLA
ncbi:MULTISPECIES: PAS domain-containing hybrid sensor histidine kinase/response regulator [unclassified Marinovum]|uniref:PAS domain-containing hybrid sensor histidine kinase/response regulator n=1 Tax=unclassified Marinovum TaxID=2647166 RepID=UPI0026E4942F|nr:MULTISPECIES: PAS domain-containing hybrid sensor histidine kinase/response regulator [unclassified Marinovum]